MTIEEARAVSIVDLLISMGHEPQRRTGGGRDIWFLSPLHLEKTPSFKVNTAYNSWKDFGLTGGRKESGGNCIDLVMLLEKVDFKGAMKFLASRHRRLEAYDWEQHRTQQLAKLPIAKESIITLQKVKSLENKALLQYIQERKIDLVLAKKYLQEAYYSIDGKCYFALAMPNDRGGYELKNKYFKGAIKKDLTTFREGGANTLSLFEGFTDFLSLLTWQKVTALKGDIIILHTLSYTNRVGEWLTHHQYDTVYTFFDNDNAGDNATAQLQRLAEQSVRPMNSLYAGYKDLNAFLMGLSG